MERQRIDYVRRKHQERAIVRSSNSSSSSSRAGSALSCIILILCLFSIGTVFTIIIVPASEPLGSSEVVAMVKNNLDSAGGSRGGSVQDQGQRMSAKDMEHLAAPVDNGGSSSSTSQ